MCSMFTAKFYLLPLEKPSGPAGLPQALDATRYQPRALARKKPRSPDIGARERESTFQLNAKRGNAHPGFA